MFFSWVSFCFIEDEKQMEILKRCSLFFKKKVICMLLISLLAKSEFTVHLISLTFIRRL